MFVHNFEKNPYKTAYCVLGTKLGTMALSIGSRNETNKDGTTLLYVRFKNKQFDKKIPTKIKVFQKHWDNKNKRLKRNHPLFELKNKEVKQLNTIVEELYIQSVVSVLSYEEARTRLTSGSYVNDIVSYLDRYLKSQMKETTFSTYMGKIRSIATNFGIKNLTFEDICNKSNWLKLKQNLKDKGRSPQTFNSYRKAAKGLHSHAVKDEITFTIFPHVRTNTINNYTPQWMRSDELIEVINNLDTEDKMFKNNGLCILIYLMMFSMRGMYSKDIEKLEMKSFVNSTYDNTSEFKFGENNMVYKHFRSKTNKMGLVYMGLNPIKDIIKSINHIINPEDKSIFPVGGGDSVMNFFWKSEARRFKKLTGHNYKSARKAFNTTASILSVPDADIRELMYQGDNTISKHYKDTQAPLMLEKYTRFHSDILKKYRVSEMFTILIDKLNNNGVTTS